MARRRMLVGELEELGEAPADLSLEDERPHRAPLVLHDAHRDAPAGARRAEQAIGRDAHVLEEDLAELGVVGHLLERADGDAGRLHVDEQQADALVLRRVGLGAAEEEAPVRDVGVARPHLLAVHDVLVAAPLRARAEPGEIGARTRLGETLAPELVAVDHFPEEALALRRRAVLQHRRADQVDVRLRGRPRRTELVEREVEEPPLHHRGPAATRFLRPRDRGPAAVGEHALPLARDLDPHRILDARPAVATAPVCRQVGVEPGAGLVAEGELAVGEREIHRGAGP
jgi:hypothetical protein